LLTEQIELAPEAKKESFAKDAYSKTHGKDANVILATARVWWRKRPLDENKVLKWLERAVTIQPKFGDAWAAMYRFVHEYRKGTKEGQELLNDIVERCQKANPTHGERWIKISKARGNEDMKSKDILLKVAAISSTDDIFM
jgi:pre-mRNA-processing factor 6